MSRARWSAAIAAAAACLALAAPARADTTSIIAPDMEVDVGGAGDLAAGFVSTGFNTLLPTNSEAGLQVDFPGTEIGIGEFTPVQQKDVVVSGSTYSVQTTYQASIGTTPTLQVTQTVTHVAGDPSVAVQLAFENLTSAPLSFKAFEWGQVEGGGFGEGVGSLSNGYLSGVFASQASATGLQNGTPSWNHWEEADGSVLDPVMDDPALEDPNTHLSDAVDSGDLHDPAVAAEYDESLAANATAPPVDVAWRFVPGAANLTLTPDDGSSLPAQPACFTATVTDAYGAPVPNIAVDFAAGDPHPDLQTPTNGAGQAAYCVTAAEPDEELFVEADVTDALLSAFSTWTFTGPPSDGGGDGTTAPPPVAGRTVRAQLLTGKVRIRHGKTWTALTGPRSLEVGTMLDTRHGTVALTAAVAGHNRRGAFRGGIFRITQATAKAPADVVLTGRTFSACKAGSTRVVRRLKAVARGHWEVVGHVSVATGSASWTTQDRCDGTLTAVQTGTVTVRGRHRTVAVHARHRALVKRG
jgi:hypothetical protein